MKQGQEYIYSSCCCNVFLQLEAGISTMHNTTGKHGSTTSPIVTPGNTNASFTKVGNERLYLYSAFSVESEQHRKMNTTHTVSSTVRGKDVHVLHCSHN